MTKLCKHAYIDIMHKQKALDFYGGSHTKVAEALSITRAAVSMWPDIVPEGSAYKLHFVTDGAVLVMPEHYRRGTPAAA